jgi:signal transduction histidine kinase
MEKPVAEEPKEPAKKAPRPRRLVLTGWALWAVNFVLLIGLTVAVVMLNLPVIRALEVEPESAVLHQAYYSLVGVSGLVLLFCLLIVMRQNDLNRVRRELMNEEIETDAVRARLMELSALFQVSTTLNLQLRLDTVLEIIVRRVVSALMAQQASIMIYNPETAELETRASYGLESEFARNARKKLGEGIAGWVAQRGQAVILNHTTNDPLGEHFKDDRTITSALSLPLRVGERCVGVLNVNRINHPEHFHDQHRRMLEIFAEHVGAVIDRAQTMERLGSRSRELEQDNQRLGEMNRMKDLFLSTASHELKTPLSSVIAYAELLSDNDEKLEAGQRREFLRRLNGEANRLLTLIEDILDVTRIETGKLVLKRARVALSEVAHGAVETTRSLAARRKIEIVEKHEADLPTLRIDEVKMRQVIVNLLVNAVRHSPEGAQVVLSTEREPSYLRIEVADQGPGIKPEHTTTIFELFGQDPTQAVDTTSVGIGLHLVKRLTELHGGHVGVNTAPGHGSRFWVRLPLSLARDESTEDVASLLADAHLEEAA